MGKFEELLLTYVKKFDEEVVTKGAPVIECDLIPFTSPMMNYITHGGFPRGRIVEFFGSENSGKTTTAIDVCVNAQKVFQAEFERGVTNLETTKKKKNKNEEVEKTPLKIVYFDLEQTFDPKWAKLLGLDVEDIYLVRPQGQSAEQLLDMVIEFLATGEVGLVVLDSVPALVPQVEWDETLDHQTRGGIAKLLGTFLRKVIPYLNKSMASLLVINQLRDSMSQYESYVTPGGKALKFYAALRLYFRKGKLIDETFEEIKRSSETAYGNIVQVRIEKTKICKPDRLLGYYTLSYYEGIKGSQDLVDLLISEGLVVQSGSWFNFLDKHGAFFVDDNNKNLKIQGRFNVGKMIIQTQVLKDYYDSILPEIIKGN